MKVAQQKLIDLGYLNDKADGAFGEKTRAAVEQFQRDRDLDSTGIITEETYLALIN